jgi:hypothetical protein
VKKLPCFYVVTFQLDDARCMPDGTREQIAEDVAGDLNQVEEDASHFCLCQINLKPSGP